MTMSLITDQKIKENFMIFYGCFSKRRIISLRDKQFTRIKYSKQDQMSGFSAVFFRSSECKSNSNALSMSVLCSMIFLISIINL